jgi:hypothetical protein
MLSSLRKWTAVTLLLGAAGVIGFALYMVNSHIPAKGGIDATGNIFLGSALLGALLAVFGLATDRTWGRWLGMATGVSGLTFMGTLGFAGPVPMRWDSTSIALVAGSVALIVLLAGGSMAQRLGARGNPFVSGGRRATLIGLSVVLSLAALPTLWAWGLLGGPGHFGSRAIGLAAAVLLGLGAILIIRQRTAGLLAMLVGGLLATGLAIYVFCGGMQHHASWEIGLQWLLAVAGGVVAIIATARPVFRVLAGKPPVA